MKTVKCYLSALVVGVLVLGLSVSVSNANACEIPGQGQQATSPVTISPMYPIVPVGTSVVVKGSNWTPGETVTISIEAGSVRNYVADPKGNVEGRVVIPYDGEKNHTYGIVATNNKFGFEQHIAFSSVFTARTDVKLVSSTDLSAVKRLTRGQTAIFQGTGFLPFEDITVDIDGVWDSKIDGKANEDGNFNIFYTLPNDVNFDHINEGTSGLYRFVVRGKTSGAIYRVWGIRITNS